MADKLYNFLPIPDESRPANDAFQQIDDSLGSVVEWTNNAERIFAYAAYASMSLSIRVAGLDIGLTFQEIDYFDTDAVAPRGFTTFPFQGRWQFDRPGVYALALSFGIEHNGVNNGRTTRVQLYNLDAATPVGNDAILPIGRNAEGTTFGFTAITEVTEAAVGDTFVFRIGGTTDSYTNVFWDYLGLSLWNVGEYRGNELD